MTIYTTDEKSRPYSIASGPAENELRFVIREMAGGEVSPWLMKQKPGELIRITPPFGWFRPGQDIGDDLFVFLATGTGIAPFLSYVQTFEKAPELCLYGIRHEADAIGLFKTETDEVFLNLASNEYFKAVDTKALKVPVVTANFKDFKNGQYKMISFFAKEARGAMARYIVDTNAQTVDDLKGFNYMNYGFSEELSKENDLVFIR